MAIAAERSRDDASLVAEKLKVVRQAQAAWARTPISPRVEVLRGALAYFDRQREEIAADITTLMGKPLAQSRNELNGFFERAEFLLETAEAALAPETLPEVEGFHRRIEHVPLGVVFVISDYRMRGTGSAACASPTLVTMSWRSPPPIPASTPCRRSGS